MKPTDLRTMDEAADEIELLQQKLEFADFEWHRAIEAMQERDNRIEALEAALRVVMEVTAYTNVDVAWLTTLQQLAHATLDKELKK